MEDIKGIIAAQLVPFDENGYIVEDILRDYINHNIEKMKVDALYIGGSTGESFLISHEEKKRIFSIAYEETGLRVPLIAQVGSLNIKESRDLSQYVSNLGYNYISLITPFYYPISFSDLKEYYSNFSQETDLPMIIYFIPSLSGVKISLDQFGELYENEKIIGVKFTSSDLYTMERMKNMYPKKGLWSGFDELLLSCVPYADGAIGSTFNVQCIKAKNVINSLKRGDLEDARTIQSEMNSLIEEIIKIGIYPSLKEIMHCYGTKRSFCRAPIKRALTDDEKTRIRKIYQKYLLKNDSAIN